MKTEPAFHNRLRDAIRLCFPMVMREQIVISPMTVWRDTAPPKTAVRVAYRDELPNYNCSALMQLINADEVTGDRFSQVIRGRYAGQECEIQLVATTLPVC